MAQAAPGGLTLWPDCTHGSRRRRPAVPTATKPGVELHVLFVCTGNVCRSPTAERLARALAAEFEIPDLVTSSAGTRAVIGHPMHSEAARVLERFGGDPSGFAARQLTPPMAGTADLVLAMTAAHRDNVLELSPRQFRIAFTLGEAALLATEYEPRSVAELAGLRRYLAGRSVADVPDPIGHAPQYFEEVGAQIARLLPPVLEVCRRTAAPASG